MITPYRTQNGGHGVFTLAKNGGHGVLTLYTTWWAWHIYTVHQMVDMAYWHCTPLVLNTNIYVYKQLPMYPIYTKIVIVIVSHVRYTYPGKPPTQAHYMHNNTGTPPPPQTHYAQQHRYTTSTPSPLYAQQHRYTTTSPNPLYAQQHG